MASRTKTVHIVLASSAARAPQLLAAARSVAAELIAGDMLTVLLCGPAPAPASLLDALAPLAGRVRADVQLCPAPESSPRCYHARAQLLATPGFGARCDFVLQLPDDGVILRGGLAAAVALAKPGALNIAGVTRVGKMPLPLSGLPPLSRGNVDMAQALLSPALAVAAPLPHDCSACEFAYLCALQTHAPVHVIRVPIAAIGTR